MAAAEQAAAAPPAAPEQAAAAMSPVVFDFSQPPDIRGFTPSSRPREETAKEKFIRKTKENPLVPIGCLGTAAVLTFGLRAFQKGDNRQSQILMRGRIFAQGFTVVALIVGVLTTALSKSNAKSK